MKILALFLIGAAAGVLGGMGLGGGTLLIPMLTILLGVEQKTAQAINLISFIPMSALSLFFHFRNGLVRTEGTGFAIIPAMALSLAGALVAAKLPSAALKRVFGGFLILIAATQILTLRSSKNERVALLGQKER
ncbi:MAG: sulfite exporter TauE/SafE family protein [Clostridia bacterium]|nr:sulfite exporter TauE/SafE family protein [Clostridia bacterium]